MRHNHLDQVNRRPISVFGWREISCKLWVAIRGWHPAVHAGRALWALILQYYSRGSNRLLDSVNSQPS
jgi:hypothetical protein